MKKLSLLRVSALRNKTVLLRVDLNVDTLKDAFKIEAVIPTLEFLKKSGARVVILSHRGRPKTAADKKKFTLRPFAALLSRLLRVPIRFLPEIPEKLPAGKFFLLENLRFYPEEETGDQQFAERLARLGDVYVNDAFAVCHRANNSVSVLPRLRPRYAGLLLEREINHLSAAVKNPRKPLVLLFGGAKLEDKVPAIKNLLPKSAAVLLGSGAVNRSVAFNSEKIVAPIDWISDKGLALDVGPLTVKKYGEYIRKAKTIVWNGPVGKFEDKKFVAGSELLAKAIARSRAFSIVGGGETTQLVKRLGLEKKFGFLSTGGGAMLDFLAGKKMPGIDALK